MIKQKPMFSCIVPVYNAKEEYFVRMLNSILKQPAELYELIIVDDGSNQETREYLDHYANLYKFKVIHQKNKKLPGARNTGIINSCGEYLVFVDADDLISNNFFVEAKQYIEQFHPDIIFGKLCYAGLKDNSVYRLNINNCGKQNIVAVEMSNRQNDKKTYHLVSQDEIEELKKCLLHRPELYNFIILGSSSGSVYSRKIVNGHLFNENVQICEDQIFNRSLLLYAGNVLVSPKEWYIYIQYESSMLHDQNLDIDIQKTFSYWDEIYRIDSKERDNVQILSNLNNIAMFSNEIRLMAIAHRSYAVCKDTIAKLWCHPIVQKAISQKNNGRFTDKIKYYLIKHKMFQVLYYMYRLKER